MEKIKGRIALLLSSARELRSIRQLVLCAMLLAMSVVLRRLSFYLTPSVKVTFDYLPIAVSGLLAGPFACMLVGALSDFLGAILFPAGAFFPGYTLTALLTGLVFGSGLYKAKPTIWRVAIVRALIVVFLHIGLNTVWSSMFLGKAFLALIPTRALKSAIQYPVDVLLLYLLLNLAKRLHTKSGIAARQ